MGMKSGTKSKIKTYLRRNGFEPHHCAWRDFFKCGGTAIKGNRLYRFRNNEHEFSGGEPRWTVDTSTCLIEDFDRWANSTEESAVPLIEWAIKHNIPQLQGEQYE